MVKWHDVEGCSALVEHIANLLGEFDVILFALQTGSLSAELGLEQLVSDVFLGGSRDDFTLLAILDQLVDL